MRIPIGWGHADVAGIAHFRSVLASHRPICSLTKRDVCSIGVVISGVKFREQWCRGSSGLGLKLTSSTVGISRFSNWKKEEIPPREMPNSSSGIR